MSFPATFTQVTLSHACRWQLARNFTGQPSVARGLIYAIDVKLK